MGPKIVPIDEVYSDLLFTKGYGHPLWDPSPTKMDPGLDKEAYEVAVGDVGYIEYGAFKRLFNAVLPANDPRNKHGVPPDFKPLKFSGQLRNEREHFLQAGPICSKKVNWNDKEGSAGAAAGLYAGANLSYKFSCASSQGAVLILPDDAHVDNVTTNRVFLNYFRDNHEKWARWADSTLGLEDKCFVLVRGSVKTTQWSVMAWQEKNSVHEVAVQAQGISLAQAELKASFMSSDSMGQPMIRSGPKGVDPNDMKPDQCVFLQYYKMRNRQWVFPARIVANAGYDELPDPDEDMEDIALVARVMSDMDLVEDPVDITLEYILRHSDADVAIASDGDLFDLFGDEEWPGDLREYLNNHMPRIVVDDKNTAYLSIEDAIIRRHARREALIEAEEAAEAEARAAAEAIAAAERQAEADAIAAARAAEQADIAAAQAASLGDQTQHDVVATQSEGQQVEEEVSAPQGEGQVEGAPPAVSEPGTPADNADDIDDNADYILQTIDPIVRGSLAASKMVPDNLRGASIILADDTADTSRTTEWPHQLLYDHTAEGGAVCCMAISKSSAYLAAGFEDCQVRVWNLRTGGVTLRLAGHMDTVWSVAFSPTEETKLVSGSADKTLVVWDIVNGDVIRKINTGETGDVWSVAYHPDGKTLAAGCVNGSVGIWNVETGELKHTLEGHTSVIMYLAFSPNGDRLVTGAESLARLWNPISGEALGEIDAYGGIIWCMAFSPDGSRIITGSEDHTARIWNVENGDELVILREHTGAVWAVAWSPDNRRVITGSFDKYLTVCDSFTGYRYHLLRDRPAVVNAVAWSPDGDFIAAGTADGGLKLWDAPTGRFIAELQAHKDKIKSVTFTRDSKQMISSSDDGTMRLWDMVDILRV